MTDFRAGSVDVRLLPRLQLDVDAAHAGRADKVRLYPKSREPPFDFRAGKAGAKTQRPGRNAQPGKEDGNIDSLSSREHFLLFRPIYLTGFEGFYIHYIIQ